MATSIFLLPLVMMAGCSSSTDPDPGDDPPATIEFTPVGQGQSLRLSETMDFSASSSAGGNLSVKWYRDGLMVGQEPSFTYAPESVGRDTLEVGAFAGAVSDTYYWVLTIEEDISLLPPEVSNVQAVAGPEPSDVIVSWSRASGIIFPLVEYIVAVSYDGPINESNWDQAEILSHFPPVPGEIRHSVTFTESADGMQPGETGWFAVRVSDDREQISPLTFSVSHEITWPWYLGGHVYDDMGKPLLGVIVNASEIGYSSNTDGSGFFLFDKPFRNIDAVRIATTSSSWYDFVTQPVSVDQDTTFTDLVLITRHGLSYECMGGEFLVYLRDVTWSNEAMGDPDASRLFNWDQFPISVFIPEYQNASGVHLDQACFAAIGFWNTTMQADAAAWGITETDYFVRTTDEASADISFLFGVLPGKYGEFELVLPSGLEDEPGAVIPEKMIVFISNDPVLVNPATVQGVALHELGHCLGIFGHPDCLGTEYLMVTAGGTAAMGRAEPIHVDERRAVRAIRNLPQGVQMNDFTAGKTEFK